MYQFIYNEAPQLNSWLHPHTKFLDKWQFGDVDYDDYFDWAEWLSENTHIGNSKIAEQLLFLILDENDSSVFLQQANYLTSKIFTLLKMEKPQLSTPKYDFADSLYAIEVTTPFYQKLISIVDERQLEHIAKADHAIDTEEHLQALKKTIYEQNGNIDYSTGSWFPDEVISLCQYYCEESYEITFCLCNTLICRNIMMGNGHLHHLDFNYEKFYHESKKLPKELKEIAHIHYFYASRYQLTYENLSSLVHKRMT